MWVDKSVSAEDEVTFGSHKVTNNSDFLVTYSALATSAVTVGQTPTDTVFILDFSTSMTWGYREDHESVAEDESRISAMITSVNHAIDTLVKANPQNRIAIAVFNGASTVLLPDLTTGEDILQKVDDGTYLSIYRYDYTPGEDGGRADVRCNINGETTLTGGGTNIQAGMFAGMKILADNRDTTAEVNGKTVTRVPNVILMSDGAPTTFSSADDSVYIAENGGRTEGIINNGTDLDPDREVQSGSWWSANSGQAIGSGDNDNPDSADGFMALLTASYYKNAISDRYYGNSGDEANIYTISFGTDVQTNAMVAMANLVLTRRKIGTAMPPSRQTRSERLLRHGIRIVTAESRLFKRRSGLATIVQKYTLECLTPQERRKLMIRIPCFILPGTLQRPTMNSLTRFLGKSQA